MIFSVYSTSRESVAAAKILCQFFKAVKNGVKVLAERLGCVDASRKKHKKLYHIFGTKFAYKSKKHLLFADFSLKAKKDKNAYHKPTPKPPKLTKLPK